MQAALLQPQQEVLSTRLLSRLARSTPRICRRPSPSTATATSTAWLVITESEHGFVGEVHQHVEEQHGRHCQGALGGLHPVSSTAGLSISAIGVKRWFGPVNDKRRVGQCRADRDRQQRRGVLLLGDRGRPPNAW